MAVLESFPAGLFPSACLCGAVREAQRVAEERLRPGSYLVVLPLNVQLHLAIFSLRIKTQLFSLTRRE